jgi:hypothetical protein
MKKALRSYHRCNHLVHDPCAYITGEGLPRFSKPIGLDFVITPEGEGVLIELQHGFGRRGLLELFPAANRSFRKRFRTRLRKYGTCFEVLGGLRRICADKITTYQHFAEYQPPSFPYRRWGPKVERWLDGLESEVILSKPPMGSCGKGIRVHNRRAFRDGAGAIKISTPSLLQSYVASRQLVDERGVGHYGCIRHIVMMESDGEALSFLHVPSYWRASSTPSSWTPDNPDRESLTANISRGAFPLIVSAEDERTLISLTEAICAKLIGLILDREAVPVCFSHSVAADGTMPAELLAESRSELTWFSNGLS